MMEVAGVPSAPAHDPPAAAASVITGIGVVAPNGHRHRRVLAGHRSREERHRTDQALRPLAATRPSSPARSTASTPRTTSSKRLIVQTDRWTWMALAAAQMALEDAAFDPAEHDALLDERVTAELSGGNEFGQSEIQALWGKGPGFVGAYQSIAWFYAATTGQISIKHGMKGPCGVIVSEGAGGLEALQHARRTIRRGDRHRRRGRARGPDRPVRPDLPDGATATSARGRPADAYRPFDATRQRLRAGRGRRDPASSRAPSAPQERGRRRSTARSPATAPPTTPTTSGSPAPDGRQYARAMRLALDDAGVGPEDVDVVFADAAGTPERDAIEATAIKEVFGRRAPRCR